MVVTLQQMTKPPDTFISAQSTLFNIYLVSLGLEQLARPLLYHTIVVWKADSLLLLWRTLRHNPNLGSLVRQISCWITLTWEVIIRQTIQMAKEKLEHSAFPKGQTLYEGLWMTAEEDVPQVIIFNMLCETPNLKTLSLQVPKAMELIEYKCLMRMIAKSSHLDNLRTLNHNHPFGLRCFPTTLQICRDPCESTTRYAQADEDGDNGFQHQNYWPMYGITGLVGLYCLGNNRPRFFRNFSEEEIFQGLGYPPKEYFKEIREIRLDKSSTGPQYLYSICQSAPQLEILRVSHRRHSQEESPRGQYHKTLNSGLLMRAATLRHLHLDFNDSREYKYYNGPDQRLTCLPELHRLETLQIQLQTLFSRRSAISQQDIRTMFPSSLVELTLDDEWDQDVVEIEERIQIYSKIMDPEQFVEGWEITTGTKATFWNRYQRSIVNILMSLWGTSGERLPQLQRVHYVSNH